VDTLTESDFAQLAQDSMPGMSLDRTANAALVATRFCAEAKRIAPCSTGAKSIDTKKAELYNPIRLRRHCTRRTAKNKAADAEIPRKAVKNLFTRKGMAMDEFVKMLWSGFWSRVSGYGYRTDLYSFVKTRHQRHDEEIELNNRLANPLFLKKFEFKVHSQNDEDGIIEEIFNRIGETNRVFVEFGVEMVEI
jgi:hypothetical protein